MSDIGYAALAGAILSLVFFYVPGAKGWYEKLEPQRKQWVMLGALLLAVAGRFGLSCAGRSEAFTCDIDGGISALETFVLAIVANAGVYNGVKYIADPGKRAIAKAEARVEAKVEERIELAEKLADKAEEKAANK